MIETSVRCAENPFFLGFFGAPNFGDELLCRTVVELFSSSGGWAATRRTDVTRNTLRGTEIKAVLGKFPHLNFWVGLPQRLRALSRASHLVIGGGGLIQDVYSTATIMTSAFDAAWMVRRRRPYIFVGLEIGSITADVSTELATFLLSHAGAVWCRDAQSAERALALGCTGPLVVAPDMAHWFLRRWSAANRSRAESHCVVNVRVMADERPVEFAGMIAELCKRYDRVTLAAAQPGEESAWLRGLSLRPGNLEVFSSGQWEETLELLGSATTLVAERFHYIAAGAHLGLRVIPLLATHKASELAAELEILEEQQVRIDAYTETVMEGALAAAVPVSPDVLDRLAQEVEEAAGAVRVTALAPMAYERSTIRQAKGIFGQVLRAGVRWLVEATFARIRRR